MPKKNGKMNAEKPKKLGRPSVFSDAVIQKIIELYKEGRTEQQVADIIGVHVDTIRKHKKSNDSFLWASKEAKQIADEMVEASLFKKAIGFNYYEEQSTKDGVLALQKYCAPDTKAQIFWLKNRKSDDWKDRVEVEQKSTASVFLGTGDGEEEIPL